MSMTKLAEAGYNIHIFEAESLVGALDAAADLLTHSMVGFDDLMTKKYQEISPVLFDDLSIMGIESPILVDIEEDGSWYLTDGHHRLAWALVHDQPVPVLFVDETVDPYAIWDIITEAEKFYEHA